MGSNGNISAICLLQLATPSPAPAGPIPAIGLRAGSPVIGRFNGELTTVSTPFIYIINFFSLKVKSIRHHSSLTVS